MSGDDTSVSPDIARVRAALDKVITDIVSAGLHPRPASARPADGWTGAADDTAVVVAYGGHEFAVDPARTDAELTVEIAWQLQDDVVDDAQAAWPAAAGGAPRYPQLSTAGTAVWAGSPVPVPIGSWPARP